MKKIPAYISFISHQAMQEMTSRLDPTEQRLVEILAARWSDSTAITVLQAMSIAPDLISPSTVHRRLKTLRAKGMLVLVPDDIDARTKYVTPGPELVKLFEQLNAALMQAGKKGGAA